MKNNRSRDYIFYFSCAFSHRYFQIVAIFRPQFHFFFIVRRNLVEMYTNIYGLCVQQFPNKKKFAHKNQITLNGWFWNSKPRSHNEWFCEIDWAARAFYAVRYDKSKYFQHDGKTIFNFAVAIFCTLSIADSTNNSVWLISIVCPLKRMPFFRFS